jgi:hypothetical protein
MSYQQDRENATKLINHAQREDFSKEWGDYLRRRALLKQYDFSNRFEAALLREDLSTWEDLIEAISRVMKRLYPRDEKRDSLGEFRYRLLERRFSGSFIDAFERVAYRQIGRKSDLITMHFSEDMSLRDLVYLEDSINKYYHEALDSLNNVNPQLRRFARENRLIKVRSFTHPGSVEIFIIGLVVVPLVTSLGAMLITNSMTRNQNRRRERVKVITARFQGPRRDIAIEGELVTVSIDEAEVKLSNDAESAGEEQRALEEVNVAAEFSEIQAPVSQGVQEIVDKMTSEPGTYAVAKSGEHVAGLENS